ncbi:MAG TPA: pyridoxamine 5'-phosphate oxidase [Sphingomicrobium sp.]|nr:pyridoxamine 5'-phosphate oxidase [Sphingomicrobium sp.]
MADDPLKLFDGWLDEARESEPNDPEAMALATADTDGHPSVRMVLLKSHGPDGFSFFTNAGSRKGAELSANPAASLLFHWKTLRRQVRIDGAIERVSDSEADEYFATRGRDSQLGAWASEQSRPLDRRETFEARFEDARSRFDGHDVPRPPYWTGFRLVPERIEFWEDRPHRLHHRRLFSRDGDGWSESLLYP